MLSHPLLQNAKKATDLTDSQKEVYKGAKAQYRNPEAESISANLRPGLTKQHDTVVKMLLATEKTANTTNPNAANTSNRSKSFKV